MNDFYKFVKITVFMSSDYYAYFLQKMIGHAMIVLSQPTPEDVLPDKHTQGEEVHGQKNKRTDRRQLRRILHVRVRGPAADGPVHHPGDRQRRGDGDEASGGAQAGHPGAGPDAVKEGRPESAQKHLRLGPPSGGGGNLRIYDGLCGIRRGGAGGGIPDAQAL